jgi:hypothetical protein
MQTYDNNGLGAIIYNNAHLLTNVEFNTVKEIIITNFNKPLNHKLNSTPEHVWNEFRKLANNSKTPNIVKRYLKLSHSDIIKLPLRIYAGLQGGIYLSHQVDFQPRDKMYYCLFGLWKEIHKVYFDFNNKTIKFENGFIQSGHFVKPAQQGDRPEPVSGHNQ